MTIIKRALALGAAVSLPLLSLCIAPAQADRQENTFEIASVTVHNGSPSRVRYLENQAPTDAIGETAAGTERHINVGQNYPVVTGASDQVLLNADSLVAAGFASDYWAIFTCDAGDTPWSLTIFSDEWNHLYAGSHEGDTTTPMAIGGEFTDFYCTVDVYHGPVIAWVEDSGTERPVPGTEWRVTAPDGSHFTVVDNGPRDLNELRGVVFVSVPWGTDEYTVTEVSVPPGYTPRTPLESGYSKLIAPMLGTHLEESINFTSIFEDSFFNFRTMSIDKGAWDSNGSIGIAANSQVPIGAVINFSITVDVFDNASGVVISDKVPLGLAVNKRSITCSVNNDEDACADIRFNAVNGQISATVGDVQMDDEIELQFTVTASQLGTYSNVGRARADGMTTAVSDPVDFAVVDPVDFAVVDPVNQVALPNTGLGDSDPIGLVLLGSVVVLGLAMVVRRKAAK